MIIHQKKLDRIEGFNGYFQFLRAEFPAKVLFEGEIYNSVAHALEAAKTEDPTERRRIRKAPTHREMLQVARHVQQPPNWTAVRLVIMEQLLRDKFRRDRELRERLKGTGARPLINVVPSAARTGGAGGGDKAFWGVVEQGAGEPLRLIAQRRARWLRP